MRPIDRKVKNDRFLKTLAKKLNQHPWQILDSLERNIQDKKADKIIQAVSEIEGIEHNIALFLDENFIGVRETS